MQYTINCNLTHCGTHNVIQINNKLACDDASTLLLLPDQIQ